MTAKKAAPKPKPKVSPAPKQEILVPEAPKPVQKPKAVEHAAKPAVAKPVAATVTVAKETPVKAPQAVVVVPKPAPKVKKVVVPKAVKVSKPKPAPIKSKAAPMIMKAYGGDVKQREAKGFSYAELKAAGVTKESSAAIWAPRGQQAEDHAHEHNVKLLESIKPKAA